MLALLAASLTIGLPTTPRGQAAPPTLAERRALGQRRIIGGELVEPEDKYFGAQGIYSSAGFLCGSTWLAPSSIQPDDPDAKADWVMTAAHCVNTAADPEDTEVSFFMYDLYDDDHECSEWIKVKSVHCHANYDEDRLVNDICLLKMTKEPKCVANGKVGNLMHLTESPPSDGSDYTAVGWGNTEDDFYDGDDSFNEGLREVDLPFIPSDECYWSPDPSQICAGGHTDEKGICLGDSGGPFLHKVDGKLTQLGVASYVSGGGCTAAPMVFTSVHHYRSWLLATAAGEDPPPEDSSPEEPGAPPPPEQTPQPTTEPDSENSGQPTRTDPTDPTTMPSTEPSSPETVWVPVVAGSQCKAGDGEELIESSKKCKNAAKELGLSYKKFKTKNDTKYAKGCSFRDNKKSKKRQLVFNAHKTGKKKTNKKKFKAVCMEEKAEEDYYNYDYYSSQNEKSAKKGKGKQIRKVLVAKKSK